MNLSDPVRDAHLIRIRDIANCRLNRDDVSIENAVRNLIAGLPAYWTMVRYSPLTASSAIVDYCNRGMGLIEALNVTRGQGCEDRPYLPHAVEILDSLIPLNAEATHDLLVAYSKLGTFRELPEIASREERAIMEPVTGSLPGKGFSSPSVKAHHEELVRGAQQRLRERIRDTHWANEPTEEKLGLVKALQTALQVV